MHKLAQPEVQEQRVKLQNIFDHLRQKRENTMAVTSNPTVTTTNIKSYLFLL